MKDQKVFTRKSKPKMENIEVIITESEETALCISVKLDSDYLTQMVEPWECDRATNSAWVRETLLFDVDDIKERCQIAEVIIEMYKCVACDPDIVQFSLKNGVPNIIKKEKIVEIEENMYDDISTNVDHIKIHRTFFRTSGEIGITEEDGYNVYNIINKECTIVYLGYKENDDIVTQNPDKMEQDKWFVNNIDELSSLLNDKDKGKIPPLVLVVNPEIIEDGCTVLDKYFDPIDCVVCDTGKADYRSACMLLSIAKRRGVMIVKGISAAGIYNFGNGDMVGSEDSHVGLINMSDDTFTKDYNFLIRSDMRMTMLRDFIVTMNHRKNIDIILIVHEVYDMHLRGLENYKVFPEFQTKQLSQIDQLSRGHVIHTPIAVLTHVPGIATMLVECGIFASCRKETVLEYKDNVLAALVFEPDDESDNVEPQKEILDVLRDKLERFQIHEKNYKCLLKIKQK